MMTTRGTFGLALLCFAFGCSGEAENGRTADPTAPEIAKSNVERISAGDVPASDVEAVAEANNAFAVDLYAQVLKQDASNNVLTSPISASLALTMALAGARNETKTQMAAVLHLDDLGDRAFAGQNALSQALAERAASSLAQDQRDASSSGSGAAPNPADYDFKLMNAVWGEIGRAHV